MLDGIIQAAEKMGYQVGKADAENDIPTYTFTKGRGKVLSCLSEDGMIYLSFGHALNPLRWKFDSILMQEICELFTSHGCERVDFTRTEDEE